MEAELGWQGQARQTFVAGLIALLPLYITYKVLHIVFELVDRPLGGRLDLWIGDALGYPVHVPGLGILITVVVVFVIGVLTRLVLFRQLLGLLDGLLERVPLVRSLYNASRQIVRPFTDEHALPFSDVVLVEYPMPGRFTLGFVANRHVATDEQDDRIVVFFPSNHLHLGYPVLLSRRDVTRIDMNVEDAVKFFVSCGAIAADGLVRSDGAVHALGRGPATALADGRGD